MTLVSVCTKKACSTRLLQSYCLVRIENFFLYEMTNFGVRPICGTAALSPANMVHVQSIPDSLTKLSLISKTLSLSLSLSLCLCLLSLSEALSLHPSRPPSLHSTISPSLPRALPQSLPPSLPPSLPLSLTLSTPWVMYGKCR